MNFLIAGFGTIGFRHYQALRSFSPDAHIHVIDINPSCVSHIDDPHLSYIGPSCRPCTHYSIIVISSSANARLKIVSTLASSSVTSNLLILEKVLVQNPVDLNALSSSASRVSQDIYVNQWFRNFLLNNNILESDDSIQSASLYGCEWGLLCNSLHFFDAFSFFSQSPASLNVVCADNVRPIETKRKGFFDTLGSFVLSSTHQIINVCSFESPTQITSLHLTILLASQESISFTISRDHIICFKDQNILIFDSYKLSSEMVLIYQQFFNGKSIYLPSLSESIQNHCTLFSIAQAIPNFPTNDNSFLFT